MSLISFLYTVLFLTEISEVNNRMLHHTKKYPIFKYLFIRLTNICYKQSTERGPGDSTVSKIIKQEYLSPGASSIAGKIDIVQIINAVEFCEKVYLAKAGRKICA